MLFYCFDCLLFIRHGIIIYKLASQDSNRVKWFNSKAYHDLSLFLDFYIPTTGILFVVLAVSLRITHRSQLNEVTVNVSLRAPSLLLTLIWDLRCLVGAKQKLMPQISYFDFTSTFVLEEIMVVNKTSPYFSVLGGSCYLCPRCPYLSTVLHQLSFGLHLFSVCFFSGVHVRAIYCGVLRIA